MRILLVTIWGLGVSFCAAGCDDSADRPENTAAACLDGVDNDGDGAIDCDDPECSGVPQCGGGDTDTDGDTGTDSCSPGEDVMEAQLNYEMDCMDLDESHVWVDPECMDEEQAWETWDVMFAYNSNAEYPTVPLPNWEYDAELAFLTGIDFDDVTDCDIDWDEFSPEEGNESFSPDKVLLVHTTEGAVFKLGNPTEGSFGFAFDYAQLL